jgi:hypothetical protein
MVDMITRLGTRLRPVARIRGGFTLVFVTCLVLGCVALPALGSAQAAHPGTAAVSGWLACPNVIYVKLNSGTTAGFVHAFGVSCASERPVVLAWLQGHLPAHWRQIGERYAGPFALSDGARHVVVESCAGGGGGCVGGRTGCAHTSTWVSGVSCAVAVAVVPFSTAGWTCTRLRHVGVGPGEVVPPNVVCARRSQLLMQYES